MGRLATAVLVSMALASELSAQNFNGNAPDAYSPAAGPNGNGDGANNFDQEKKALIAHGAARFKSMREEEERKYSEALKACNSREGKEKAACRAAAAKEKQKFLKQLNKSKIAFKKFSNSKNLILHGKTTEEVWNGFNERQINDTDGAWGPYADRGPIGSDSDPDPVAQWWTEIDGFQKQRKDAAKEGKLEFKTLRTEQAAIFGDRLQACGGLPAGERAGCRKAVQEDKKQFNADFNKAQKDYLAWVKGKEVILRGKTEQQVFQEWAASYEQRTGWAPAAMPAALAAGDTRPGGGIVPLAEITEVGGGHAVDPSAVAQAEQEAAEEAHANGELGEGGAERLANTAGSEVDGQKCSDEEKRKGFRKCRIADIREHRKEDRAELKEFREDRKEARAECAKIADIQARSDCFKGTYAESKEFRKEERLEDKEWRQDRREDKKIFEDKMKAERKARKGVKPDAGTGTTAP